MKDQSIFVGCRSIYRYGVFPRRGKSGQRRATHHVTRGFRFCRKQKVSQKITAGGEISR